MNLSTIKDLVTKRNLAILGVIFALSISLAFGIGYLLGKSGEVAPILIQKYSK